MYLSIVLAFGLVPFLTDILSRTVPLLSHVRNDALRSAWTRAICAFCEAVRECETKRPKEAVEQDLEASTNHNNENGHSSALSRTTYTDQAEAIYDVVFNWFYSKDPKTRAEAGECIGELCLMIRPEKVVEDIKKLVNTILGLYKKAYTEQHTITKAVCRFLEATCTNEACPLDPYVEDILNALFPNACLDPDDTTTTLTPQAIKNHSEAFRCFHVAASRFADKIVYYLLHKIQILYRLTCQYMEHKKSLLMMCLRKLLAAENVTSIKVKRAIVQLCVALSDHAYVDAEGGDHVIAFLVRNLVPPTEQDLQGRKVDVDIAGSNQLRTQSGQALNPIASICICANKLLWPYLFEFICMDRYFPVVGDICKCLRTLVTREVEEGRELDFETGFDNGELFIWNEACLELLSTCIAVVVDGEWRMGLAAVMGKQLDLYKDYPDEKAFLLRCLGTTLSKIALKSFVVDHLMLMFKSAQHHVPTERQGCARGVGACDATHTELVSVELENVSKWEHLEVRAPTMTPQELRIISEFYVQHYNVFHSSLTGSSRQPKVKDKKEKLEELSRLLSSSGYPTRTPTQLDQRIRDTMKKAKHFAALEKEERMKTGGGIAASLEIPPHVAILLDKIGNKPRVKGLTFGKEICGNLENENNVKQSLSWKRGAERDTDSNLSLTDDEDYQLNNNLHSEKLGIKKIKCEPHDISHYEEFSRQGRNVEDHRYREAVTSLQPITKGKENLPIESVVNTELNNRDKYTLPEYHQDRLLIEPRRVEKDLRAGLKPNITKTSELETERLHMRIRKERLTLELLHLQIEHARLLNENARLENVKLRLQIDNELKGNDYIDDFDN